MTETKISSISIELLEKLDLSRITLLDMREPDEVLVKGVEGAVNIPFSRIGEGVLDKIARDKPVCVMCQTGNLSEQVTEILADRGYDAFNVEGGYDAYRQYIFEHPMEIDAKGLKCPGPIVKVADALRNAETGRRFSVEATEDAFASDISVWCERTGNPLVSLTKENGIINAVLEKGNISARRIKEISAERPHGKNFVVFSGDLDKTIAVFIMANGAAAMGREVTVFFTFWGLNILRKHRKVRVKKNVVEKMFGFMMPRGTDKLGLSKMNMGGLGAKMIRRIMRSHNIQSLEELIRQAIDHGVRLVACQMSMEIMGIRKEELIKGVELGGVSTFLGAGEKSDMSLFI